MRNNFDSRLSVLVIRMTGFMGGIENYIYNLVTHSDKNLVVFDFLVLGFDESVYYKELNAFYGDYEHFIFVPLYREHFFKCIRGLKKLYSERNYDVIYICGSSGSDVLFAAPYIDSRRTVIVQHSHSSKHVYGWQHKLFKSYSNCKATIKLACSDAAGKWLFGEKVEYEIVNNGIDTDRFTFSEDARKEIRHKYGISEQTFVIGNVGRLSHEKNHLFLLEIFERVLSKKPNSLLMLVGEGEERKNIEEFIKEHDLSEKVMMVGITKSVEKYYSTFDAFVMPSLWEGLPVVGIEAQASGLQCFFSSEIDKQIIISDRAYSIGVNADAEKWAMEIVNNSENQSKKRADYSIKVKEAGYDVKEVASLVTQKLITASKTLTH